MTATISCVDVGQGDCTVAADDDTGDAILVDCRAGRHEVAIAELLRLGVVRLSAAIVSHSQMDHFGGVLDVLEGLADRFTGDLYYNHDSLMVVPVAGAERKEAGARLRALLNRAREYRGRIQRAEVPRAPGEAGAIRWELLAPTFDETNAALAQSDPNLASGVVLIQVGNDAVVVGGDAQRVTWERLDGQIPVGSIVRWPHHGGSLGADAQDDDQVLQLLQPTAVIVSVGSTNPHGHPTEDFFAAVAAQPVTLICTQATSACVAGGGPGGVCAGTIRIGVGGPGAPSIEPDVADHANVVAAFGHGRCVAAPD